MYTILSPYDVMIKPVQCFGLDEKSVLCDKINSILAVSWYETEDKRYFTLPTFVYQSYYNKREIVMLYRKAGWQCEPVFCEEKILFRNPRKTLGFFSKLTPYSWLIK